MKTRNLILIPAMTLACAGGAGYGSGRFASLAQTQVNAGAEGREPYTPTKIECLHLECSVALHGPETLEKEGYVIAPQREGDDTIVLAGVYRPTVNRKEMNRTLDFYRKLVDSIIKRHHWEGWAKVTEEMTQLDN